MKKKAISVLGFIVILALAFSPFFIPGALAVTPQAYVNLGFGMFVHYGINTYTGTAGWDGDSPVSVKYPSRLFAPTSFDPGQWAAAAKAAGMTYLIYTAKHYYGWCGWNSAYTDYDVATSSVPSIDTVREVSKACAANGLKFGIYYSCFDRTNYCINNSNNNDQYIRFVKNQIAELLTNYGEVVCVWFDMADCLTEEQCIELKKEVHSIQPGCITIFNHRADISDVKAIYSSDPEANNTTHAESEYTCYPDWWAWNDTLGPSAMWTKNFILNKKVLINSRNASFCLNVAPGPSGRISDAGIALLKSLQNNIQLVSR